MRVLVGGSWVPTQSTRAVNSELTDFLSRGLMFLVLVRYPSFSVGGQCLPTLPVVFETLQFLCYSLCVAPCVQNTVRNTFYPKIWVRQRKLRPSLWEFWRKPHCWQSTRKKSLCVGRRLLLTHSRCPLAPMQNVWMNVLCWRKNVCCCCWTTSKKESVCFLLTLLVFRNTQQRCWLGRMHF